MKEIYLINAIMYEMEQLGNTDVSIDNIRFLQKETDNLQWQMFHIHGGLIVGIIK